MHARALRRRWYEGADPVVYCTFDLLALDGRDLRVAPIEQRKAKLKELLQDIPGVLYVDHVEDGAWLYQCVLDLRMEGIVAKRRGSAYRAGLSTDWLKIKRPRAVAPARALSPRDLTSGPNRVAEA